MPPIPSDCTDLTVPRKPRTRLNFGLPAMCESGHLSRDINSLQFEGTQTGSEQNVHASVKRPLRDLNFSPEQKRRRFHHLTSTPKSKPVPANSSWSPLSSIIQAVDKLSTESDLVADGSRASILPTMPGKHSDLSAISPETISDVLDGLYDNRVDKVTVIDCRYPYEYEGGHIKGAVNLYSKELIEEFLQDTVTSSTINHVLIFHCEFSSERGPKMYRFLRSLDRDLNQDNYPRLNFPEIYLLEGGYKAFFYTNKDQCVPQTYKPMLHKEHKEDLRHLRVKSKSWSAGDRSRQTSLAGMGLRLRF